MILTFVGISSTLVCRQSPLFALSRSQGDPNKPPDQYCHQYCLKETADQYCHPSKMLFWSPGVQRASGQREQEISHRLVWCNGCSAAPAVFEILVFRCDTLAPLTNWLTEWNFQITLLQACLMPIVTHLWVNDLHEGKHGVLEECSGSERPLCCLGDVLGALRPHAS